MGRNVLISTLAVILGAGCQESDLTSNLQAADGVQSMSINPDGTYRVACKKRISGDSYLQDNVPWGDIFDDRSGAKVCNAIELDLGEVYNIDLEQTWGSWVTSLSISVSLDSDDEGVGYELRLNEIRQLGGHSRPIRIIKDTGYSSAERARNGGWYSFQFELEYDYLSTFFNRCEDGSFGDIQWCTESTTINVGISPPSRNNQTPDGNGEYLARVKFSKWPRTAGNGTTAYGVEARAKDSVASLLEQ